MKLSEAIRLGSMLKPQGFGHDSARMNAKATCAFGAVQDALGRIVIPVLHWPWLTQGNACPACGELDRTLSVISVHLNDAHRWSRERIADWVATIEPSESPEVPEEKVLEAEAAR